MPKNADDKSSNLDMNLFKDDILNTLRESLLVLDSGLHVVYVNHSFYTLFKVAPGETEGKHVYDLGNGQWNIPELRTLLDEVIPRKSSIVDFKVHHIFPTIGEKTMIINATQLRDGDSKERFIVVAIDDTTEKTKYLEAMFQSHKLAMIGQFSAGIAHGLSSPLTGIHNFLAVYAKEEPKESVRHSEFELMLEACNYMNKIIRNLTYFARTTKEESRRVSLADVIDSTLSFSERQFIASNIFISRDVPKETYDVIGNKGQLQHVLLNILINSKEAMPNGGKISIKARNCPDKGFVIWEIADSGKGISKGDLPHVFEPFFTTKKGQGGAGLGLPAVYGIIMDHHGKIKIESEEGQGARVIIRLPSAK